MKLQQHIGSLNEALLNVNEGRATGRSYRQVLLAVLAASSGLKVLLVSDTYPLLHYILRYHAEEVSKNKWVFAGGGELQVKKPTGLDGQTFETVITDHYYA